MQPARARRSVQSVHPGVRCGDGKSRGGLPQVHRLQPAEGAHQHLWLLAIHRPVPSNPRGGRSGFQLSNNAIMNLSILTYQRLVDIIDQAPTKRDENGKIQDYQSPTKLYRLSGSVCQAQ